MPPRRREDACAGTPTQRWCPADTCSLELHNGTAAPDAAFADNIVEARFRCQQQVLESRPGSFLEPLPFLDRDHDSGLNSPPRDHLGALFNRCIQKLAETRLSVLYLPGSQVAPPPTVIVPTSHRTSQS